MYASVLDDSKESYGSKTKGLGTVQSLRRRPRISSCWRTGRVGGSSFVFDAVHTRPSSIELAIYINDPKLVRAVPVRRKGAFISIANVGLTRISYISHHRGIPRKPPPRQELLSAYPEVVY